MRNYNGIINESRRRSKKNRVGKAWPENQKKFNQTYVLPKISSGMEMIVSDRFKYILTKMADTGNKIAKDLLQICDQKVKTLYDMSYLDLTPREDTLSYLPNGGKDLPESERYKSNKRQHSKIYKVIKTIFSNRYTKDEVKKFVSVYKSIYNKGPEPQYLPPLNQGQLVKKLMEDTKKDKLKWVKSSSAKGWVKYETTHKITENKNLLFSFYIFNKIQENYTFLSIHFQDQTRKEKDIFIKNFKFSEINEIVDFTKEMIKKYNINFE